MHSTVSTPTSSPLPSQLVHIPSATSSTPRLPSSLTSTYEHQSISTCWCPSSSPASSPSSSSSRWPMGVSSCTCGDDELIGENKSIVIRVSLHLVDQDDDFHSYRFIANNNNNNTNTNNNNDAPIQETSNSHFSIHPLSIDTETNTLQLLLSLTSTSSSTSTTCMYSYFALADDEHSKYILFKGEYIHNSRYTNEENFKMTIVDRSNMKAKVFTLIEECDYTDTDSICSIYGNKNCVHVSIDSDDDDDEEEEEEDYYYDYYQVSPVYVPSSSQRSLGDNMSLITSLYDSNEYEYDDASVMMAMMTTMIISWRISTTWCILNILIHSMSSASSSSSSTPNKKENTE